MEFLAALILLSSLTTELAESRWNPEFAVSQMQFIPLQLLIYEEAELETGPIKNVIVVLLS